MTRNATRAEGWESDPEYAAAYEECDLPTVSSGRMSPAEALRLQFSVTKMFCERVRTTRAETLAEVRKDADEMSSACRLAAHRGEITWAKAFDEFVSWHREHLNMLDRLSTGEGGS